jgi:hypothetical protein
MPPGHGPGVPGRHLGPGLADAAFDAEAHHRYCREDLGVRSTVIPLNRRDRGRKWPKTTYRRQMVKRFRKKPRGSRHRRVYGQRWQAGSAFSRHKRRLGSALGGRSDEAREREGRLRVLTHTRSGPGIKQEMKPELVDFGGNYAKAPDGRVRPASGL